MTDTKPIYLMAGGREGKSWKSVIRSIFKDIGKASPTIAYVGVASGDDWEFYLMIAGLLKKSADCQVKRVLIVPKKADLNKARSILESSDAVFVSGGDVEAGMAVLKEKNLTVLFRHLFQEGKLFFGASAGSIMIAREWVRWRDPDDDSTAELFPCLALAPVLCDTHAEGDDWEELKAAVALKTENSRGFGIASGACLKVSFDGKLEALGGSIAQYVRRAGRVEKIADIEAADL
jgi:peptidase E